MNLMYLDIPNIYGPTADGFRFISALLETPNQEILGLASV